MAHPDAYLVLANQRSGSTLLVESLRTTGVAGAPEEFFQRSPETSRSPQPRDWFAGVTDPDVLALLPERVPTVPDPQSSVQWRDRLLREGRSPNGVWGGKLMWNQTPLVLRRAVGLPDRSGDDLRSALRDILGDNVLFIHVSRPDVVHQAVSFWRATQSQSWRAGTVSGTSRVPQYHARGIAHLVPILREQERGWADWFAETGIEPVRVNYRDLAANTTAVVADILTRLGQDPSLAPRPVLSRQADVESNVWVERYLTDAAREGLPV